jgi:hypothetical protein
MSIDAALEELAALEPGQPFSYSAIAKKVWCCAVNIDASAQGKYRVNNYQERQPATIDTTTGDRACQVYRGACQTLLTTY